MEGWSCKVPPPPPPPGPNLWPLPAKFTNGSTHARLSPDFAFGCAGGECGTVLKSAFARYTGLIWAEKDTVPASRIPQLSGLTVAVNSSDDSLSALQFGVNESYTLHVNSTSAVITAETAWGAMWGLESFFQLVMREPPEACSRCTTAPCRATCGKYIVREHVPLSIVDRPRTRWRGLMIDVSAAVL